MTVRTAFTSSAGPVTQPTFQPVTENVLPADEIVTVRSRHAGQGGQRHVLAVEDQVLVDLVGDRDQVVLDAHGGDRLELGPGEDLAGRVVRGVEQHARGCAAVTAARSASRSKAKSGGRSVTHRRVAPASATQAA